MIAQDPKLASLRDIATLAAESLRGGPTHYIECECGVCEHRQAVANAQRDFLEIGPAQVLALLARLERAEKALEQADYACREALARRGAP